MSGGSRIRADGVLLTALAAGKQVQLAAAEAGVSERTVFRRLASPTFQQQLASVQSKVMDASIGVLSHALRTASERLVELLNAGSEQMQLRAAQAILSQMAAVRTAILSDLRTGQAGMATDKRARKLSPTDNGTDGQEWSSDENHDKSCQPTSGDVRPLALSPRPSTGLLTSTATDCQTPADASAVATPNGTPELLPPTDKSKDGQEWPSYENHDKSCQPMPGDIRPLALSPRPSTGLLTPTDTDCQTPADASAVATPNGTQELLPPTDKSKDGQEWPSYENHDKSCQPMPGDVRPLALSSDPSADLLTAGSRDPRRTEDRTEPTPRKRVRIPRIGWGIKLPMAFQ